MSKNQKYKNKFQKYFVQVVINSSKKHQKNDVFCIKLKL